MFIRIFIETSLLDKLNKKVIDGMKDKGGKILLMSLLD